MGTTSRAIGILGCWLCLTASALAQASGEPRAPVVTVVGASVSGGFQDVAAGSERNGTIKLQRAFDALWGDGVTVLDRSDVLFFKSPTTVGARQIKRALRDAPDLVVGVDFLFWFGYGYVPGRDSKQARLDLQRIGLQQLEGLQCPMILGDYPDMTGADPRMVAPAQIPQPDELAALNAALRAWATQRKNVSVFPLAAWVKQVKSDGWSCELGDRTVRLSPENLLQSDRLHATRLGVVLLADRLREGIAAVLPEQSPLRVGQATFVELLERSGADVNLPASVEPATSGKGSARQPQPHRHPEPDPDSQQAQNRRHQRVRQRLGEVTLGEQLERVPAERRVRGETAEHTGEQQGAQLFADVGEA